MSRLQESSRWPRVSKFTLSACAAAVAELVTFPLDLTKTRLQIQGEGSSGQNGGSVQTQKYRGMLSTAAGIVREEGPLKLWQGVTPAIYRHIVYSGGRMLAYEQMRESVLGKSEDGIFPVWKAVIASMISGALGQFIASPTDLVKVQMQMEGRRRLEGKPPRVRGVYHAFTKILAQGGIRGLWAGWVPNVQRAALVNLGGFDPNCAILVTVSLNSNEIVLPASFQKKAELQGRFKTLMVDGCFSLRAIYANEGEIVTNGWDFPPLMTRTMPEYLMTYDTVKHFLLRNTSIPDNSICHGLSSICSGLVAATMGTPADVVKTRVMNQPRDSNGRGLLYRSSTDCLVQSVRREGFFSLYKGFLPTWFRMAPWSLTFWLTFEQLRRAMGISSF